MERRRFRRLRTRVPLVGRAHKSSESVEGEVMNMSEGGFSFETGAELPLKASFGFEIKNEDGSVAIEARGQVRWCSPSQEREGSHWVGVMFEPPSEAEAERIRSFVRDQTVDEAG